ncbi:MAG: hypothetical protein H7123_07160 [Thermoleophilia bacterium]|nr:hypothetical protein [Thermoleophilia bacterium]
MLLIVAATDNEMQGTTDLEGVETLVCGIGPVDAAIRVAARLAVLPRPAAILHIGIAGTRHAAGIIAGEIVIGSAAVYCDTTSRLVEHRLMPDGDLLHELERAFPHVRLLEIGTSANVGGSSHLDVEAMEGFAVLRAAELAQIPAIEVRAISNEIEEPDRARWNFDLALDNLAAVLPRLISALTVR